MAGGFSGHRRTYFKRDRLFVSYLLDTNICVPLLNENDPELIQKLQTRSPEEFYLCSVVKAELLYGARKSERIAANLTLLQKFFAQFHSLPFDDAAAEFYGTIRALLAKAGTPIGGNDFLIASIAQTNGLTLLTRNQNEFIRVPGLQVEVW